MSSSSFTSGTEDRTEKKNPLLQRVVFPLDLIVVVQYQTCAR